MKIQSLFLKNFRSIGETGLELFFPTGSTIFIGENNAGKTSIFEAIKMMIRLNVSEKIPWDAENWYANNHSNPIELCLTINLDYKDVEKIVRFFEPLRLSNDLFEKLFSNQLTYKIVVNSPSDWPESFFILGNFTIHNSMGKIGDFKGKITRYGAEWGEIAPFVVTSASLEIAVRRYFDKIWANSTNKEQNSNTIEISEIQISFQKELPKLFLELLKDEIIPIEEYREKPKKDLNASLISPTGESLGSILFNLKNGRPKERSKFEKIQHEFHEIFPNLNVDVIKENDEIKILTQKNAIESTTYFLGAGILQTLLIVTHIVAHNEKILLIDHPEIHLHPHAERNLSNLIDESKNTQIFLITHSPYFTHIDKQHKLVRITQKNSQAEVNTLTYDYLTNEEYAKLEYLLDVGDKELFFARKVLLVEGQTEIGAIPVFAKAQKYSFDKNGISIIEVNGKSNLGLFARLCEGYHIPYHILADSDAEEILKDVDIPNKSKKNRLTILSKDFEALLPEEIMKEAKRNVGRSKPRVGRYVANEMVKQNLDIPPEILKLINKLKELQS